MPLRIYTFSEVENRQSYKYATVCVSVCVDCYSCSMINEVQVRASLGFFLDFNLWICKIMLRSRIWLVRLLGIPIAAFSEQ